MLVLIIKYPQKYFVICIYFICDSTTRLRGLLTKTGNGKSSKDGCRWCSHPRVGTITTPAIISEMLRVGHVNSFCPRNSIQMYIANRDKYTCSPRDMYNNVHRDSIYMGPNREQLKF